MDFKRLHAVFQVLACLILLLHKSKGGYSSQWLANPISGHGPRAKTPYPPRLSEAAAASSGRASFVASAQASANSSIFNGNDMGSVVYQSPTL